MSYSVRTCEIPGPPVRFQCPACGNTAATGTSFESAETLLWLHLIPTFTTRLTFVRCDACQARLYSAIDLTDLERNQGSDVTPFLSYEPSFVVKFLATAALLLGWVPIVGLVLAGIAYWGTRKFPGVFRTFAYIGLTFAVLETLLLAAMAIVVAIKG